MINFEKVMMNLSLSTRNITRKKVTYQAAAKFNLLLEAIKLIQQPLRSMQKDIMLSKLLQVLNLQSCIVWSYTWNKTKIFPQNEKMFDLYESIWKLYLKNTIGIFCNAVWQSIKKLA